MNSRNSIYTVPFNELLTQQGRLEFVKSLARLDKDSLREILLDQHTLHHNNLVNMHSYAGRLASTAPGISLYVREQIQDILDFDSFQGSFLDAPPDTQKIFLLVLLKQDHVRRQQLLESQAQLNPENLTAMLTCLMETWTGIYDRQPAYLTVLNSILNLKESHAQETLSHVESDKSCTQMPMPASFRKALRTLFADPISLDFITSPWITPQGTTYQFDSITQWIHSSTKDIPSCGTDPMDRSQLSHHDLLPNKVFSQLAECLLEQHCNLEHFYQALRCPLSGERLRDPVLAEDGITYERAFLEAYLLSHDFFTPRHVRQRKPLYPNRVITSLYDQTRLDKLLDDYIIAQMPLMTENASLIKPLRDYLDVRSGEDFYAGLSIGYNKWEKMISSAHLIQTLSGFLSPQTFFGRYPHELKALKQGRLKTAADPGLQYLASKRPTS